MSELPEPSYYEIALTNRQVLAAFVLLLGCLVAAFFAGVWVGRGEEAGRPAPQRVDEAAGPLEEQPEEFTFFDQDGEAAERQRPDMEQLAEEGDPGSTLAEDLGVTSEPEPPAEEAPPATEQGTAGGAGAAPPEPADRPAAEAAAEGGPFVIQVFSSRDEVQARRLLTRLQAAGFEAFMATEAVQRQTMYRVRIGPFTERGRAEAVADRVRAEFRVDTWITQP